MQHWLYKAKTTTKNILLFSFWRPLPLSFLNTLLLVVSCHGSSTATPLGQTSTCSLRWDSGGNFPDKEEEVWRETRDRTSDEGCRRRRWDSAAWRQQTGSASGRRLSLTAEGLQLFTSTLGPVTLLILVSPAVIVEQLLVSTAGKTRCAPCWWKVLLHLT